MINPKNPIYWYQGLFLQPQHLQQMDLYHESLLTPLRNYTHPYFWGVCKLEISSSTLKDLVFDISDGEFIFKDGTWVSINHNAVLQPRTFKPLWEKMREPFTVYVALKRLSSQGESIDKSGQDSSSLVAKSRYILNNDSNEVQDLYNRGHVAQVDSLKYLIKLVWDKELDFYPDYEVLPIARVEYDGRDAVYSREFTPPVISVKNSVLLLSYLKNTKEMLYARSTTLSNYKNLRKSLDGEYQPNSLPFLIGLKTICNFVPLLNHYAETPDISPWNLYGVLRQLAGELSIISDHTDALGFSDINELLIPPYDHENLGNCFKHICILIDDMLDDLISSMESLVHLVRDGNYFKANIPVDLLKDTNKFYLCIKSKLLPEDLINTIVSSIKIGSMEDTPILIKRALSGVSITPLKEAPQGLSRRKDVTYFALDHTHSSWVTIKEYANISVFLSDLVEHVDIDLLVLKGGNLLA